MRRVGLWLLLAFGVMGQLAFLPLLRPLGVVPALLLVLIVLVALEATVSTGLLMAVVGGILVDLMSGGYFGLWTGVLVLEVLVAGLIRQAGIDVSRWLIGGVLIAAGSLVMALVIWVGLLNWATHWPLGWMLGVLGLEIVLNWMLMIGLRPVVRWCAAEAVGGM